MIKARLVNQVKRESFASLTCNRTSKNGMHMPFQEVSGRKRPEIHFLCASQEAMKAGLHLGCKCSRKPCCIQKPCWNKKFHVSSLLCQEEAGLDLSLLQEEVMRQQGDVAKACQILRASSSTTPTYPENSDQSPGLGEKFVDWGKGDENGLDSLYGSMQSEFTNLELDHSTGEQAYEE